MLLAGLAWTGCYEPGFADCRVACDDDDDCAADQVCGADGLCASPDIAGECQPATVHGVAGPSHESRA